jgi:hypothetical protein
MQQFDSTLILTTLKQARSSSQAFKMLELATKKMRGVCQTGPENFVAMGWEYRLGDVEEIENEQANLEVASDLSLECGPEIIFFKEFQDEQAVLVSCIAGCAFRAPISCHTDFPVLLPAAQQQVLRDVNLLASEGYFHQVAMSGYTNWFLHPDKSKIVFGRWESMRSIADKESERLNDILGSLFSRYEADAILPRVNVMKY